MKKSLLLSGLVLTAAFMTGCEEVDGKLTGGGTMHSAGGDGKTVFTYNGERCPDKDGVSQIKGKVVLHDKTAIDFESVGGVDLHGAMTDAAFCKPVTGNGEFVPCGYCNENTFEVEFDYSSTNNKAAGEGDGIACLWDFGKGNDLHGAAYISLLSGPYSGYENFGAISGQVNIKECPNTSESE